MPTLRALECNRSNVGIRKDLVEKFKALWIAVYTEPTSVLRGEVPIYGQWRTGICRFSDIYSFEKRLMQSKGC